MARKKASKKGTRGRPPMPKGQARDRPMPVRVRPDEHAAFDAAAKAAGQTLSDWIRDTLKRAIGYTDS